MRASDLRISTHFLQSSMIPRSDLSSPARGCVCVREKIIYTCTHRCFHEVVRKILHLQYCAQDTRSRSKFGTQYAQCIHLQMKAYRGRAKQRPFCCARPYLARFQTSLPNPVRSTAHCLGACATTDVSAS